MLKIFSLCMAVVASLTQIAKAADANHGQVLAQRWCVTCHAITVESQKTTDMPPSFASIAKRDNFNENRLAFFLLNPHPVMPNMGLSRSEATASASASRRCA